jgi:hypothetical protein
VLERLRRDGGGAWRGIGEAALCLLLGAAPALLGEWAAGFPGLRSLRHMTAGPGPALTVGGYLERLWTASSGLARLWGGRSVFFAAHYDTPFIAGGWLAGLTALWGAAATWAWLTAGRRRDGLTAVYGWVVGTLLLAPFSPRQPVRDLHLFFLLPFPLMLAAASAARLYDRYRGSPLWRGLLVALVAATAGAQAADLAAFGHVLTRDERPGNVYARVADWVRGAAFPSRPVLIASSHYYRGLSLMDEDLRGLVVGEEGFTGLPRASVRDRYDAHFRRLAAAAAPSEGFHVLVFHDVPPDVAAIVSGWSADPSRGTPRVAARFLDWDGCVMAEAHHFREGTPSPRRGRPRGEGAGVSRYRRLWEDRGVSVTGGLGGTHSIDGAGPGNVDSGLTPTFERPAASVPAGRAPRGP